MKFTEKYKKNYPGRTDKWYCKGAWGRAEYEMYSAELHTVRDANHEKISVSGSSRWNNQAQPVRKEGTIRLLPKNAKRPSVHLTHTRTLLWCIAYGRTVCTTFSIFQVKICQCSRLHTLGLMV